MQQAVAEGPGSRTQLCVPVFPAADAQALLSLLIYEAGQSTFLPGQTLKVQILLKKVPNSWEPGS